MHIRSTTALLFIVVTLGAMISQGCPKPDDGTQDSVDTDNGKLKRSGEIPQQPTEEQRELATRWLLTTCFVGDTAALDVQLKNAGEVLEPFFLRAYRYGPDSTLDDTLLAQHRERHKHQFERIQKPLMTRDSSLLPPRHLALARKQDRSTYIANANNDFIVGFKGQAILALGLVGGDSAKAELSRLERDSTSELQSTAAEALARLNNRRSTPNQIKGTHK